MANIMQMIDDLKAQQLAQAAKLTALVTALTGLTVTLAKIQTDETVLFNEIEALKALGDPATIQSKLAELSTLAQGNIDAATAAVDTATTVLETANAVDARVPETPEPAPQP